MNHRLIKYYFSIIISLLICSTSIAQKRKVPNNPNYDADKFHLGFSLGYNNMFFRMQPSSNLLFQSKSDSIYGLEVLSQPGFNLGMISELNIFKYLSIRMLPGMNFGQRNIQYKRRVINIDDPNSFVFETYEMLVPSIDVEMPVLLRLKGLRVNNYRPYIVGGGNVRYDLETRRKNQKNADYSIKLKPLDFFFEVGAGLDFYLTYFKFSTELKMSYGIKDILVHEPNIDYNTVIDRLKTKMFILSFNFE